jgi:hypothetical protein
MHSSNHAFGMHEIYYRIRVRVNSICDERLGNPVQPAGFEDRQAQNLDHRTGLPDVLAAIHTSRLSCRKARTVLKFRPSVGITWES